MYKKLRGKFLVWQRKKPRIKNQVNAGKNTKYLAIILRELKHALSVDLECFWQYIKIDYIAVIVTTQNF